MRPMDLGPLQATLVLSVGAVVLGLGILARAGHADAFGGQCYTEIVEVKDAPTPENPSPAFRYYGVRCAGSCPQPTNAACVCAPRFKAWVTTPEESPNHPNETAVGMTCSCFCVPHGGGQGSWTIAQETSCFAWIYGNPQDPLEFWYADCATVGCPPGSNCAIQWIDREEGPDGTVLRTSKCDCQ